VTEAEFSNDKGKAIWEIEMVANDNQVYELEIDATIGKVLSQKLDTAD